jgi:hypothetical protein
MKETTNQSEGFKEETKLASYYKTRTGDQLHTTTERQESEYKLLLCPHSRPNVNGYYVKRRIM